MSHHARHNATAQPHDLCSLCQTFWKNVACVKFTPEELCKGGEQVPSMPEHLLHSSHRSEVVHNASSGCHFCSIIMGSVSGCTGDHCNRQFSDDDGPIYISIAILDLECGTFLLTLFPCDQPSVRSHDQILSHYSLILRPMQDRIESPAPQSPSSRFQTSTYSEAAADFVKSWIRECKTSHFLCGTDYSSLLLLGQGQQLTRPRRLLDLQAFEDPDRIRLVKAESSVDLEYCALSYSWGFSKPFVLTSSNLVEFHKEIHLATLPTLLRDAIQVARSLDFRYLWIDALCIMQDGRISSVAADDWIDQAGKMSDIFGNAVVTIAASECFDGSQSLFRPRNPLSQITCHPASGAKLSYEVVPPCTPHCLSHAFDKARYHLDTRAWVFQERILSPRTVHCTRNFIHLECRAELRCEAAIAETDTCHHGGAVSKLEYQALFSIFGIDGLAESAVDAFLGFWHELMRKYALTNLSRQSDLLVALAGLGKEVQQRSRLTWSFGLWREHILREMLWYLRQGRGTPCRERAPSWSWASIEVQGPEIIYDPAGEVSLVAEVIKLPDASEFARSPGVLVDETKYSIKVTGRLRPGVPDSSKRGEGMPSTKSTSMENAIQPHRNCIGRPKDHPECPFHPDYDQPENTELYSLLLAYASGTSQKACTPESWNTQVGLVLTPIAGYQSRYRRVGYFHHDVERVQAGLDILQPSLFEDADVEEIEIV